MSSMNKTIFYVSDEGGEANKRAASIRVPEQAKRASTSGGGLEGLRIVIHEGDEKGPNNVLTKSVATTATSRPRRLPLPELGFLQTCCFCMRELKPCRDVYMYRGDQGFCSDECRSRQIDWANEESLK
ncbi:FCS-Like Zinc finger 15-like [Zingiber officinale]|uniref:FCS-Like Zinc finger 15-like n=1 Tax=Zingiber officinale TaxID=94328 RepID=UPI001C4CD19D|nr:FCS-Like Zinc finger 15-like [Zingiber officinale]